MPYKDIEKRSASGRRTYSKHGHKYKGRVRRSLNEYRERKRLLLRRLALFKGCLVCGYKRSHHALCYHHVDASTKLMEVSRIANENYGWQKLRTEIRKCVVLCMNCHAEVHAGLIDLTLESSAGLVPQLVSKTRPPFG